MKDLCSHDLFVLVCIKKLFAFVTYFEKANVAPLISFVLCFCMFSEISEIDSLAGR